MKHGTVSGYAQHYILKIPMCDSCRQARKAYDEKKRRAKGVRAEWRPALAECGTRSAYNRHLRRKEEPCEKCRAAQNEAVREHLANSSTYKARKSLDNARRYAGLTAGMTPEDWEISKSYVQAIANDPCIYCGSTERMTLEHKLALSKGGTHHWWNLAMACRKCNLSKSDIDYEVWVARKKVDEAP